VKLRRIIPWTFAVLTIGVGAFLLHGCFESSAERAQIKVRYSAMELAIRAGDTNAARLLFAPAHRPRAADHFSRFQTFARPLDHRSGISVSGTRAVICPRREFPLIPIGTIGHTIEMIKVDGEWYFTGKISIW
jgi:hypothetical protein